MRAGRRRATAVLPKLRVEHGRKGRKAAWPGRPNSGNSLGSVYYKIGGGVLKRIVLEPSTESVALPGISQSDDTVKSSIVLGSSL